MKVYDEKFPYKILLLSELTNWQQADNHEKTDLYSILSLALI